MPKLQQQPSQGGDNQEVVTALSYVHGGKCVDAQEGRGLGALREVILNESVNAMADELVVTLRVENAVLGAYATMKYCGLTADFESVSSLGNDESVTSTYELNYVTDPSSTPA